MTARFKQSEVEAANLPASNERGMLERTEARSTTLKAEAEEVAAVEDETVVETVDLRPPEA